MHCNGKCHLMKELAKAAENEKPISDKKIVSQNFEILFFQEIKPFRVFPFYFPATPRAASYYSNLYFHQDSSTVFHPPTFIS